MKFSKVKCKVLHLVWAMPSTGGHSLRAEWIDISLVEKDLSILVGEKMDMS